MKKILSLILVMILAFSVIALAACQPADDGTIDTLAGKTPEELYQLSQEKLREATSYSVYSAQVITMTYGGQSMVMNQTVNSKVNGDNTYSKVENDTSPANNMEAWYIDGTVYGITQGMKIKSNITKEEYMEKYMGTDPSESTLLDIPQSWFENIVFEKEGDGWALNFVVSGEKYTQVFKNIGLQGATISGDVNYKMIFTADGELVKLVTSFDMLVQGVTAHCDSISEITIGAVTVTAPENPDSFQYVTLN